MHDAHTSSFPPSRSRLRSGSSSRLVGPFGLLLAILLFFGVNSGPVAGQVAGDPATVSGTVWNDINADTLQGDAANNALGTNILDQIDTSQAGDLGANTYGDPIVPGAGVEAGYEGVRVCIRGSIDVPNPNAPPATITEPIDRCTFTDANGEYLFDLSDVDPTATGTGRLRLIVAAPNGFKFSSANPAGDNDADEQPNAPVPPDPWRATIPVNYTGAGITDGTDAGLRPLPEISIAYVDLNAIPGDGVQGIETGTPSYNVFGNCATTAPYLDPADPALNTPTEPGDDCHKFDDTVRTNDVVTFTPSLTLDNSPAGGIDNVIIEMQFSPVNGADLEIISASSSGIPTSCLTGAGVDPQSSVTNHPDGSITLICNMGNLESAQLFAPISIKPSGDSPNGSSFTTEIRAYAADNDALPSEELPAPEIFISAAPQFDLSKNSGSATSPPNRVINAGNNLTRTNPVTGVVEGGKAFRYEMSLVADGDGKGSSSLSSPFTFEEIIDPRYEAFGAHMYFCEPNPYQVSASIPTDGNGALPYDEAKTADSGNWDCPAGTTAVTITGADTSGAHYPSTGQAGNPTAPWNYVATGQVRVWYPFTGFYRFAGPDGIFGTADDGTLDGVTSSAGSDPSQWGELWAPGDGIATGTYPITNCVGSFDPDSIPDADGNTVSNYGDGLEPGWDGTTASGNNCRNHSYTISIRGSFTKRFSGELHLTNGTHKLAGAPAWSWSCTGTPDQYIVPGQTACSTGDGPVVAGQFFTSEVYLSAESSQGDLLDPYLCETIDVSTYRLAPIPVGASAGDYAFLSYHDLVLPALDGGTTALGYEYASDHGFKLEFGRFTAASGQSTWQIDHFAGPPNAIDGSIPLSNPQQQAAAQDCGVGLTAAGDIEWTTTQTAFSADEIVMVRGLRDDATAALGLGDRMILNLHFEARDEFYAPDVPAEHTTAIPTGVILPNNSNFAYDTTGDGVGDFGTGNYDPTDHVGINGATTTAYGDRLIFQQVFLSIEKEAYKAFDGSGVGDDDLLEEFAGDPIMFSLHPAVTAINNLAVASDVVITDVLPAFTSYAPGCTPPLPAGVTGPVVIPDTPNAGETTLVYTYTADLPANVALPPISICANTDAFAPAPVDVVNNVMIEASNVAYNANLQEDERAVRLLQIGRFAVKKAVDFPLDFQDTNQVWTLTYANTSEQIPFAAPDIIDVFPFNGDGPGVPAERETFESDFDGTIELVAIPAAPSMTGAAGGPRTDTGQWYATCDLPATVNPDASDAATNDLVTGSTTWIAVATGSTADPDPGVCDLDMVSAVRWVSDQVLAPLETGNLDIELLAVNNLANDIYVNRYSGYTSTFLNKPVRSNEPFVQIIGFSLGDIVWLDVNDNGVYDLGTDVPAPAGTAVDVFDSGGVLQASTTTDADGRWFVEGLTGGQYDGISDTYVAGAFYVEVTGLPASWVVDPASPTFEADPNTNLNEDVDHHATDVAGVVTSAGFIELSASIDDDGLITGDEPAGENVNFLGDPLVRDDLSNFSLDLMLVPQRGDIALTKVVEGGGPLDGWLFTIASVDLDGCPLPAGLALGQTTDATGGGILWEDLIVAHTITDLPCEYTITETPRPGWSQTAADPAPPYSVTADQVLEVEITNTRDVGDIEVTKTVDGADAPAGWEFSLTSLTDGCDVPNGVSPQTTTDGSGGAVAFVGVPTHSATVDPITGFAAECEYEIAETAQTGWTQATAAGDLTGLTVTKDGTTSVGVLNEQDLGEISVTKELVDADNAPLPIGWTFDLVSLVGGCDVPAGASPQTTADGTGGTVTFTDLPTHSSTTADTPCTYRVTETTVTGWSMVTDLFDLVGLAVADGETTEITVENTPIRGDLAAVKTVEGGGPLDGWVFTIASVDPVNCPLPTALIAAQTTDGAGAGVLWADLLAASAATGLECTYTVTETPRPGWTLTAADPVGPYTVTADDVVEVEITNTRDVGSIAVTKTVEGADAPAGWVFTLTSLTDGCDVPAGVSPQTTADGSGGTVTFAGVATHSAIADPQTGLAAECQYEVAETAQTGWTQATDAADLTGLTVAKDETTSVGVLNEQDLGDLSVTKVLVDADNAPLPTGWTFELTSLTAGCDIPVGATPQTTADGTGGTVTFTSLPTHSVTDLGVECLYEVAEVATTGWTQVTTAAELTALTVADEETTEITVENTPTRGDLAAVKTVEGGGPLDGWVFTIASVDPVNCPLPTALVAEQATDALGGVLWTDLLVASAATGLDCMYTVTETPRPGWTQTAVDPVGPYTVDDLTIVELSITNTRDLGDIEVTKTVEGTVAPTGWEFSLVSLTDGCEVPLGESPQTTADGSGGLVTFIGLPTHSSLIDPATGEAVPCAYEVTETAQTGWTMVTSPDDLTGLAVTTDAPTEVAVLNAQDLGAIEVTKELVDAGTAALPAGWTFELTSLTTGCDIPAGVTPQTTDDGTGGLVTFSTLPTHSVIDGAECLYQITEPVTTGWTQVTSPADLMSLTVISGESTQITIENTPAGPVELTKNVVSGPTEAGEATYEVVYEITITNSNDVPVLYNLTDEFAFADGVVVLSADVANTVPGDVALNSGFDGDVDTFIAQDTLEPAEQHVFTVTVVADVSAVSDPQALDCDTTDDENTGFRNIAGVSSGTAEDCVPIPSEMDVAISKVVDIEAMELKVGESGTLTYTLLVTNEGIVDASGVTVAEYLPAGAEYISAVSSKGDCTEADHVATCVIGELAVGETVQITVMMLVTPTEDFTMTNVAVVSADGDETNPDNNEDEATTDITVTEPPAEEPEVALPRTGAEVDSIFRLGLMLAAAGAFLLFVRRRLELWFYTDER